MKLVAITVALLGFALSGCGSGAYNCSSACNKIYDECRLALQDQSGPIDKAACNTRFDIGGVFTDRFRPGITV